MRSGNRSVLLMTILAAAGHCLVSYPPVDTAVSRSAKHGARSSSGEPGRPGHRVGQSHAGDAAQAYTDHNPGGGTRH